MYDFFPPEIRCVLLTDAPVINELRIRADKPVSASYGGIYRFLEYCGKPIILNGGQIQDIVFKACEKSVYAYNDCIKQGYICSGGVRIGLCGEFVTENGVVKTMKNYNALCVRIPHEVKGCALSVADKIITAGAGQKRYIKSTLVISPPGVGKTTFLRDIARIISDKTRENVLIIDEKNEIYSDKFDLGLTTDVLSGCDKRFAFFSAIKTICPGVIIADELTCEEEADGALFAKLSGSAVICSVHAQNYSDAEKKDYLKKAFSNDCFELFVTLKRERDKVVVSEITESGV